MNECSDQEHSSESHASPLRVKLDEQRKGLRDKIRAGRRLHKQQRNIAVDILLSDQLSPVKIPAEHHQYNELKSNSEQEVADRENLLPNFRNTTSDIMALTVGYLARCYANTPQKVCNELDFAVHRQPSVSKVSGARLS